MMSIITKSCRITIFFICLLIISPEISSKNVINNPEMEDPLSLHAGERNFDLDYAKHALANKHFDTALFAYERVLIGNPLDPEAALGVGICYFHLKMLSSAKNAFESLTKRNVDKKILDVANKYLDLIALRDHQARTRLLYYVRVDGGYDSNTNATTTLNTIFIPDASPIILPRSAQAAPSYFSNISAGINVIHKLNDSHSFFGNISTINRFNQDSVAVQNNFSILNGTGGLASQIGKFRVYLPVNVQYFFIGGSLFRRTLTSGLEMGRLIGAHYLSIMISSQFAKYHPYADRDNHLFELTGNWIFRPLTKPIEFSTRLSWGNGKAIDPIFDDLIRNYLTLNIVSKWTGILHHTPFVGVFLQKSLYNLDHFLFLKRRADKLINVVGGWEWQLNKNFSIITSASYSLNKSNIELFKYKKYMLQIGLKYKQRS